MEATLRVLALDTASALTAVALISAGDVFEEGHFDPRGHAEAVTPMVRAVLRTAGVTRPEVIACGVGPGPYTGLRVGIATARALALSWAIPIVGVCSLDAVAWAAQAAGVPGPLGVAMDARRREVYWATYAESGVRTAGPGVCSPSELPASRDHLHWIGSGVAGLPARVSIVEPQPWGQAGLPGLASAMALRVQRELLTKGASVSNSASAVTRPQQPQTWLADHGSDTGSTARALAGRVILPSEPLYLRRPDAVASQA